jgi:hypothetical protein
MRIELHEFSHRDDLGGANGSRGPRFNVYEDGADVPFLSFSYLLPTDTATDLVLGRPGKPKITDEQIDTALLHRGVEILERALVGREFVPSTNGSIDSKYRLARDADVDALKRKIFEKACGYQAADGRDLYCTATRRAGAQPTTRAICAACRVPDAASLCSHFTHAAVSIKLVGSAVHMTGPSALCELGRDEVDDEPNCRAGGHACWERIVEPPTTAPATTLSPLAIHEAFDFLSVVWQLATGNKAPLIGPVNTTCAGKLAQPATSQTELDSRLSALADLIKAIDVPDTAFPGKPPAPKDHTLTRLLEAIGLLTPAKPPEPPDSVDDVMKRVGAAVEQLRTANNLRNAAQHSQAREPLPKVLERLGLPFPMPDAATTWARVQTVVVEAAGVLRDELRRLV